MKKLIKTFSLVLIFALIVSLTFDNAYAKEKTLGQIKAEAKANRDAYNKAKSQKELTEQEKQQATAQKAEIERQIGTTTKEIEATEQEISNLQKEIDKKDKQIKSLMSFVQISNGESNYLEYAFGASSFTDFIYRISVAEQMSDYNDNLIKEYNENVEQLNKKKEELNKKQQELGKKQQELNELEAKLSKQIETLQHGMMSKDDEYKTQISLMNNLIKMGCSESETMTSCQRRIAASMGGSSSGGKGSASTHTGYGSGSTNYMPLARGYVSSPYGQRSSGFHTGIDFSNHAVSNVYPVAPGKVVAAVDGSSNTCGNHIIYVYHPSSNYTTSYWHLINRSVSIGQTVTPSTVLGQTGSASYTDPCAQGGHVHLNLFNGLTVKNSGRINPGAYIKNIPGKNVRFTSPR